MLLRSQVKWMKKNAFSCCILFFRIEVLETRQLTVTKLFTILKLSTEGCEK